MQLKAAANTRFINYSTETKKLMGMFMYANRLDDSPYKDYFTQKIWDSLIEDITKAFCVVFGLPLTHPLTCAVDSGLIALPVLSKYLQIVKAKAKVNENKDSNNDTEYFNNDSNQNNIKKDSKISYTNWYDQNELATEISLPDNLFFHSVFACPVSKEQSTTQNKPMMMPCGHTICKDSLEALSKSHRGVTPYSGKFKCPYCPEISHFSQAKNVYF
ncbi:hypothetical protein BB561_000199 [Smittium simulii]|uniref:GID complex catalytic subunit 2 n=1 Tax=Smittium simulii TaxID=133385 RepID=A0A2T9Z033_9FUNG|nr:hypothetical protein BB561_000199 [Smittium simulii]